MLDTNQNVTRVEVGPNVFVKQDHEIIVTGQNPVAMISLPPYHYCIIENPVKRMSNEEIEFNQYGEAIVSHGDVEIRMASEYTEPFPLYYREKMQGAITALRVVEENTALRIECVRAFGDKQIGDEWLFKGPATYIPRIEERVVTTVKATVIGPNQALRLKARKECTDYSGVKRQAGEEWLVRQQGAYLA